MFRKPVSVLDEKNQQNNYVIQNHVSDSPKRNAPQALKTNFNNKLKKMDSIKKKALKMALSSIVCTSKKNSVLNIYEVFLF
jgi:hypothetical protein